MLFSQITPDALATYIVGGATIAAMVILAGIGSYMGSVRSVGKIEVKMADQHGQTREAVARVETAVDSIHEKLEAVGQGRSPHIAEIRTKIEAHDEQLKEHDERIGKIEIVCATQHGVAFSRRDGK